MLARTELAQGSHRARKRFSAGRRSPASRRLRKSRRGIARRTLLQWVALASLTVGGLAVVAWTQERGTGNGEQGAEPRVKNAIYDSSTNPRVRLAQDTRQANELRASRADTPKTSGTPKTGESRNPNPERRAANADVVTRRVALRHIGASDFEAALAALSLRRVAVDQLPEGDVATFETSGQDAVRIYVARNSGKLSIQGPTTKIDAWLRLVETIDVPVTDARETTKLVTLRHAVPEDVRKTVSILQAAAMHDGRRSSAAGATRRAAAIATPGSGDASSLISVLLQPRSGATGGEQPAAGNQPANRRVNPNAVQQAGGEQPPPVEQPGENDRRQPVDPRTGQPLAEQPEEGISEEDLDVQTLRGQVRVEYIEELDKLVVTGHPRDVEIVLRIIRELELQTQQTRPVIEVYELQHVENSSLSTFITTIYAQVLEARQGTVSITPLVQPNALLLIGRQENVDSVIELIKKLDQPIDATAEFETFRLKHASAFSVQRALREFYGDAVTFNQYVRAALGTKAHVVVDYRTNSLIVQARPRDMAEIRRFIDELDVSSTPGNVNQIRTVKLRNSLAQELAPIIQQAITGPAYQPPRTTGQQGQGQQFQQGQQGQGGGGQGAGQLQEAQALQARSVMLQLLAQDENGQRLITSDILSDVRVTAEPRGNALIVSAPEGSMDLIVALIEQIDQLPPAEAQIKVFAIVNADAQVLANTLNTLFAQPATGGGGGNQFAGIQQQNFRIASADDEGGVLIPLRIAVEQRTNSVIVTGSPGDLAVVQALLVRLDDPDARERQTKVVRLKNSPAQNVADAINLYLTNQRSLQQQAGDAGLAGTLEQFEREVIVVAEPVSNSLIVSATPRYFQEITELVEKLDERPPMVMIQVLIAEVVMRDTDEFGVEMGLQDSILFDRSLAGLPGFAFNNAPLGNNTATGGSDTVGSQSLSTFGVGRTNADLGFGGLVMSASSESISVLLRALQENRRLDVLSRPHVMALDNQPAFVQVGQQVPQITGISNPANTTGTTNFSTQLIDVGIILTVIPRISPDGMVVMEIDATKSAVGPIEEGIPISIAPNGDVIRSPRIDTQRAQTTVMAASGQTVILGGLITKRTSTIHRQLPWIGDLPYIGRAFSFDSEQNERTELMIIMTPHVVRNELDNDLLKQVEASRMSWCLADVYRLHGPGGPKGLGLGAGEEVPVFYPDEDPAAPAETPGTGAPGTGGGEPSVLNAAPGKASGGEYLSPPVDVRPEPRDDPSAPIPPRPLPTPTQPLSDDQARTLRYDAPRYGDEGRELRSARYDAYEHNPESPGGVQRLDWQR